VAIVHVSPGEQVDTGRPLLQMEEA
jgi:hypothetical protein